MRDARNNAFEDAAIARNIQRTEAQGVHHGDGPRAHGEDVAQDAAHTGGRALKRLNEAGMVVRFDLERDGVIVADVDDAGVFAWPLQDQLAARGQLLQVKARAFVRAMLAPHHAEDAEFGIGGLAAEQGDDLVVFRPGELVGFDDFGRHRLARSHQGGDHGLENYKAVGGAHQRLGDAFRMRHQAHDVAAFVQDAGDVAHRSVGIVQIAEHDAVFGFELIERALVGDVAALAMGDQETPGAGLWWLRR